MEWQITCHPCPGNPRTKEQRKRRGPTLCRSSNARFFRDLPFGSSRLYRRLGCLPPVLSVFFPLLLSLCLLYFCVSTTCEFRVLRSQICALESPNCPVRIERLTTWRSIPLNSREVRLWIGVDKMLAPFRETVKI